MEINPNNSNKDFRNNKNSLNLIDIYKEYHSLVKNEVLLQKKLIWYNQVKTIIKEEE